ncbi:hypothetical protein RR48_08422 [Papilio machaon]|uniref:Uncharacterized protein n=1 Tax=Papilio machaon TaxID=76193 RepID=A0A194QPW5_PAPMA|nr:hypothetical protein RR48_08422 [Papilio machaon]
MASWPATTAGEVTIDGASDDTAPTRLRGVHARPPLARPARGLISYHSNAPPAPPPRPRCALPLDSHGGRSRSRLRRRVSRRAAQQSVSRRPPEARAVCDILVFKADAGR